MTPATTLPDEATATATYLDARKKVTSLKISHQTTQETLNNLANELDQANRDLAAASTVLTTIHSNITKADRAGATA